MIVWGGATNTDYLNTGGRYNPSTDSWTATSTTNAPSARSYHLGGAREPRQLYEYRREILRARRADAHSNSDAYAHGNSDANT
jgi:hypothetical protein